MDEGSPEQDALADDLDVVEESRHHILALSAEGWGVWESDRELGADPIVLYPPDDNGFDLAHDFFLRAKRADRVRNSPWLDILRWAAFLSGTLWVLSNVLALALRLGIQEDVFDPSDDGLFQLFDWTLAAGNVGNSVFLVSAGAYLILWLRRRDYRAEDAALAAAQSTSGASRHSRSRS